MVKNYKLLGSSRLAIAIVGLFGFINIYALRINMSVAMVCMTDQYVFLPNSPILNSSTNFNTSFIRKTQSQCKNTNENFTDNLSLQLKSGEFPWPKQTQGYILGSFFWGYLITQIPGGWLAHQFGGKRVFGWSMLVCAIATILMPFGARLHYVVLMILRFICGLCQGVVFPAMHCIWSRWAPSWERATLLGLTFSGTQLGNVVALPLSGLLCEYGFDGGWPTIFYVFGGLGILWFIAWTLIVFDCPEDHPRIHSEEKRYIQDALRDQVHDKDDNSIPWRAFATSLPLWAIIVTHTCANWGTYTFLTNTPTFLAEVLQLDLKSNGFISALPYIGFWLFITISGFLADCLLEKRLIGLTGVRKLFNSFGLIGPGIFVILLSFVGCGQNALAITLLTIGVALSGFQYSSGFVVNHADIAPRYAGLLFGITNTFATIPGFASPALIGLITKNKLRSEWQIVFYVCSAIYFVGGLFFIFFASGKVQPWAHAQRKQQVGDFEENEFSVEDEFVTKL